MRVNVVEDIMFNLSDFGILSFVLDMLLPGMMMVLRGRTFTPWVGY